MAECNPSQTPMEARLKPSKTSQDPKVDELCGELKILGELKTRSGSCGRNCESIYGGPNDSAHGGGEADPEMHS